MNTATLKKWNTSIKNFETAVEDFNKIASQNLDENEKKLENIQTAVKRELENLEKYSSYAEVRYQQLSEPKCCDPTPLMIKQIGCILSFDMCIRIMSVACLAFFGESLAVKIVGFVIYAIAEMVGVCGSTLSFKYGLEINDIQFTSRIYHEKIEDFKQFDRVLDDFRDFQKFIAVTKFSLQNDTKPNTPNASLKNSQEQIKKSNSDFQKTSSNLNIKEQINQEKATVIILENKNNLNENTCSSLEDEIFEKNESLDSSNEKNEVSIDLSIPNDLTIPKINKKISKCLKSYQKLSERFHSEETE
ncbi:MAG: hypothetical protein Q8K60_06845, partial [Parachlamydiaceae bacterium]|nr:hypothetical protein [Parachlamydiaceae bacterium]